MPTRTCFGFDADGQPEGRLRLATRRPRLDGKRYPDAMLDADLRDDKLKGTLNLPAAGPTIGFGFRVDGLFEQRVLHIDADARVKLQDLRGVAPLPAVCAVRAWCWPRRASIARPARWTRP